LELKLVNKEKDSMEIEILGENETLLEPLKQKLLEDDNVEIATFLMGHPMLESPKLIVKVKSGKPQAALKKAAKALANDFEEFRDVVMKETTSKSKP
jgi:DNA-directed RNA polymerase subunit L